jgi:polyisoprenoid-binding protein YceI
MPRLVAVALSLVLAGAASPTSGEVLSLAIDPGASRVRIHLGRAGLFKFLGHDHEIDAPIADGRVEIVEGDPARSSVRLRFEARRLAVVPGTEPASDIPKVEERMRGPEVLDVARYPDIAFQSSSAAGEAIGKDRYRLRVRGALEVKGRSFLVEIPLEVHRAGDTLEATGEVGLRLRELGVEPPSVAAVVNVANDFRVTFEVRARREDPVPPNGPATP